ncbi:MAG: HAD family hydrolase [Desulfobacteraceae bacterium]|nr:MAG: HAD family hydrolase [Desulfobacteraceae bacterium]
MNPVKKISAVIFDCDGVMFDSRQANINFYNHLLQHFDLPPMSEDKVAFVHMHTADESIRHIFSETPYVLQAQEYRMHIDYTPFVKDMVLEPGLKELLEELRPSYGLAVATNRSNTIEYVLESNGLSKYFDIVVSSLDVQIPKPHPESLFKILRFFKIGPDEALYVGDSLVDYETARAAGVPFIAYKNRDLAADSYSDRLMDIADLLNSRNNSVHRC